VHDARGFFFKKIKLIDRNPLVKPASLNIRIIERNSIIFFIFRNKETTSRSKKKVHEKIYKKIYEEYMKSDRNIKFFIFK